MWQPPFSRNSDSCSWLTCESDLDEVQRMQHQGRDDATGDARDEIFILEITEDIELTRRARCTATLNRRHVSCWHAVAPLVTVRYRSVIGDNRFRILANASNTRLHSATYLLVCGRHCRRAVVASHVPEIRPQARFLRSLAITVSHSWLTADYATSSKSRRRTAYAERHHTDRPGSYELRVEPERSLPPLPDTRETFAYAQWLRMLADTLVSFTISCMRGTMTRALTEIPDKHVAAEFEVMRRVL